MVKDIPYLINEPVHILVICFASLIHTLHVLEQHSVDTENPIIERLEREAADLQATIEKNENETKQLLAENEKLKSILAEMKSGPSVETQIEKATAVLAHEYNEEIRAKDEYISYLESKVAAMQLDMGSPVSQDSECDPEQSEPWRQLDLPEKNVIFMGGT